MISDHVTGAMIFFGPSGNFNKHEFILFYFLVHVYFISIKALK